MVITGCKATRNHQLTAAEKEVNRRVGRERTRLREPQDPADPDFPLASTRKISPDMKLLILGATGPTGRHLVDLALRSGDSVTAFVRNPGAMGDLAERVTPVIGDATSQRDI